MKQYTTWILCLLLALAAARAAPANSHPSEDLKGSIKNCPPTLTPHPLNRRYFRGADGEPIQFAGLHTWDNFQDWDDTPPDFNFTDYLNLLAANHHNFIRSWAWEGETKGAPTESIAINPLPWKRVGNKFDLDQVDDAYFNRLRQRVQQAASRGIYVSIMLFDGWSLRNVSSAFGFDPWASHPFHPDNNVNGIDGNPNGLMRHGKPSGEEVHTLNLPEVTAIQEAYVRRALGAVSDLDNVLWEISNESHSGSTTWQEHMVQFIKTQECVPDGSGRARKKHPVGRTAYGSNSSNSDLWTSAADWVSPASNAQDNFATDPPDRTGAKVILSDSDHLFVANCGNGTILGSSKKGDYRQWIWKSFTRGIQNLLMETADQNPFLAGSSHCSFQPAVQNAVREARVYLGDVRDLSERLDLTLAKPDSSLCQTGYCLADPGEQYLAYSEDDQPFWIDLEAGELYQSEWFNPRTHTTTPGDPVGGGRVTFVPPVDGPIDPDDTYHTDWVVLVTREADVTEVTLDAVADAYVRQNDWYGNQGSSTTLSVRDVASGVGKQSLVRFDVPVLAGTVQSAKLRLRTQSTDIPSGGFYRLANTAWADPTVTFDTWDVNGLSAVVLDNKTNLAANAWHSFDVGGGVSGNSTVTFALAAQGTASDAPGLGFRSRESGFSPRLRVTYGGGQARTFTPVQDAWAGLADPFANHGTEQMLYVRAGFYPAPQTRYSFLKFQVTGITGTVQSATLDLRTLGITVPGVLCYRVDGTMWAELGVTFDNWNRNDLEITFLGEHLDLDANSWHEIDVTAAIDGSGPLTLAFATSEDLANLNFHSRESSYNPQLVISYSP